MQRLLLLEANGDPDNCFKTCNNLHGRLEETILECAPCFGTHGLCPLLARLVEVCPTLSTANHLEALRMFAYYGMLACPLHYRAAAYTE
eukprot:896332-Pelagomonas_calceolata.AAC.1